MLLSASANATETPSDEEQILKLEDDWVRALKEHDREGLDEIVVREFTFIEPDGSVIDRDVYLSHRSSAAADIGSFEIADVKVRVFGDAALVTG